MFSITPTVNETPNDSDSESNVCYQATPPPRIWTLLMSLEILHSAFSSSVNSSLSRCQGTCSQRQVLSSAGPSRIAYVIQGSMIIIHASKIPSAGYKNPR
ncbi:hypothetical protein OCU04_005076 [Sclerotinia nivalis]|uniref:Uncharacterized protein n=1 Tax=Sclerotinia nivalis TaxID=352851 RepID=A0A9X0AP67_9HELO|nr:hypothetical protein OCU04_005076 [Sclerotinia nivalis]